MASLAESYMRQTCQIAAPGTPDQWGAVTYAAATTVRCRATWKTQRVRVADGEIVETKVELVLPVGTTVGANYRVTSITGITGTFTVRHFVGASGLAGSTAHVTCYLD